jgi:hypothetical protein
LINEISLRLPSELGMIGHACNPSLLIRQEDHNEFKASPGKKFVRPYLKKQNTKLKETKGLGA